MRAVKSSLPAWGNQALALSRDLEEQGIPYHDPEHKAAILNFLTLPTESKCECGAMLQVYQRPGGKCEPCAERYLNQDWSQDSTETKMARMNVPPRYFSCTLAAWIGDLPGAGAYEDWLEGPSGKNLYLHGRDNGVGKSHLAVAAIYNLQNAGHRCWWVSSAILAKDLAQEARLKPEDKLRNSVEQKCGWVEYLVVDDLGKNEDAAAYGGFDKVAALIDLRDQRRKATIVTTNLLPDDLRARNQPLYSRLLSGINIEIQGEDKRWGDG